MWLPSIIEQGSTEHTFDLRKLKVPCLFWLNCSKGKGADLQTDQEKMDASNNI